jgi:glucose-fructose oxidoreductase
MNEQTSHHRRDFLMQLGKGIGVAAFGLPLLSACGSPIQNTNTKNKLGVALVGLGGYSEGQLAPALQLTEHCYLAGIVTGTKEKEKKWVDKYNIPAKNVYNYENFDQIAQNKAIDIIYIVLPNSMHKEYVIRAAKTKKQIICEKPMALSAEDCQTMIEACKTHNVKLSIGYRMHFDTNTQRIMQLSKDQTIGKIKYVEAEKSFVMGGDPNQWRLKKALSGGGSLMDIGIYAIQGIRYSIGEEPIAVVARELPKSDLEKFKEVDDSIEWHLEFPSGAMAKGASSYSHNTNLLYIAGEKGLATFSPAFTYTGVKGMILNETLGVQHINQQARQMDAFAMNVKENTESSVAGIEGLKDMKVIDAIYQSIEKGGKRVEIR